MQDVCSCTQHHRTGRNIFAIRISSQWMRCSWGRWLQRHHFLRMPSHTWTQLIRHNVATADSIDGSPSSCHPLTCTSGQWVWWQWEVGTLGSRWGRGHCSAAGVRVWQRARITKDEERVIKWWSCTRRVVTSHISFDQCASLNSHRTGDCDFIQHRSIPSYVQMADG